MGREAMAVGPGPVPRASTPAAMDDAGVHVGVVDPAITPPLGGDGDAGAGDGAGAPSDRRLDPGRADDRSARAAVVVFAGVLVASFVGILVVARHQWFTYDEWDFLVARNARSLSDLFHPHNEHLSTLPILVYRGLFRLFGLRTYLPYQALVVLLHLTAAALLRAVMRRAGVGPWVATIAASLFAVFGAGAENIIWAFQIGFVGSLVFGLAQLLLAGHDGPVDRRDGQALVAGGAALLCSGVGVTMVIVVGLATLIRRGWRAAALQTVPLGALFLGWYLAIGRHYGAKPGFELGAIARWVWAAIKATFVALGQVPGVGLVLAVLLAVGLVVAWRPLPWRELRRQAADPAALLVGAVLFLVVAGTGRALQFGPSLARTGRYLHLVAAFVLPALAVAADAIARRHRLLLPLVLGLLLVGVPGNLDDLAHPTGLLEPNLQRGLRTATLALPRLPLATRVPRWVRPQPRLDQEVTIGWLRDQVAAGRLPKPPPLDPVSETTIAFRLVLAQGDGPRHPRACHRLVEPEVRRLARGQGFVLERGALRAMYLPGGGRHSVPVQFAARTTAPPLQLTATIGPTNVRLAPDAGGAPAVVCEAG